MFSRFAKADRSWSDHVLADEKQNVHNWLDSLARDYPHWVELCRAQLAQPRMPQQPNEPVTEATVGSMSQRLTEHDRRLVLEGIRQYHQRLYLLLTTPTPKTKEVEVWHVEYAVKRNDGIWCACIHSCETRAFAEQSAATISAGSGLCVQVTGPHKQTIPAD